MLQTKSLYKTFNPHTANEVRALRGINLQLEEGSFVCVLGTNGSGKSTLLNALAGSFMPDKGKIILDGQDITTWPEYKRAKYIGRVFQNPFSGTAPDMTIAENLALAMKRGGSRKLGWALHKSYLDRFTGRVKPLNMQLEDRLHNPIGKLSGGQRQALTLLMATWKKPKLLLLDEHTAALDPKTAARVIQLTEEVVKKDNLTTLMVTHSMQQAVKLGDRILMMHKGEIVYDFSAEEKKRLQVADLLAFFDEIRRKDQIDPSVSPFLKANYV